MQLTILILFLFLLSSCNADVLGFPEPEWDCVTPESMGLDSELLRQSREYALTGDGSGCVIFRGKMVSVWGERKKLYDLKSSSKSIGVSLLGVALKEKKVALNDAAIRFQPSLAIPPESNRETGWIPKITIQMLAEQTAGFDKPGKDAHLLFEPGTVWSYSDAGPNWLAECLTLAFRRDLNEVIFEKIFIPIGISPQDIQWRKHVYRPEKIDGILNREFGSGFSANIEALSRIGYLYLREGTWKDNEILPTPFVRMISQPMPRGSEFPTNHKKEYGSAAQHYSILWWNNNDGKISEIPKDAFWAWGLYDSIILVIPSLDLVAVRTGKSWSRQPNSDHYDVLKPFFIPIAAAVK
ncbi:MAG: serine hydrolase [Planctomycetaceae bacterium]|jgi:CubicO group peptidase (beta-lactamase class C family)|nr:serine hydrolase [Planctomycetaceae bacterium]